MWIKIRYWLRRKTRKSRIATSAREFDQFLSQLSADDIVVDCGANVGDISHLLAQTGARLHAFEPDPAAFKALSERFDQVPNVTLHNAAVGTENGVLPIFLAKDREEGSLQRSQSTSLLNESKRVTSETAHKAKVVDFVEFLESLEKLPTLIKMDIEGAEVALLEKMFACGIVTKIEKMFVETHEKQIPSLRKRTFDLVDQAKRLPERNVSMDWK